jgi:hypothetical protein
MKQRDYYVTPKSSAVMRFLWKAAGGDRYILERATYSDQIKYMCLGGIVFATGAMAGLAGGYAFYTIFSPKVGDVIKKLKIENPETVLNPENIVVPVDINTIILSVLFGLIWGLIIFNIDRFIVTSTGKGDGTEKITWDEFKNAIPRIIMGIIIAFTISKPIEIRMFEPEILGRLSIKQKELRDKLEAIDSKKREKQLFEIRNGSYKAMIDKYDTLNKDISMYAEQTKDQVAGLNGAKPGYAERAKFFDKMREKCEKERNDIEATQDFKSYILKKSQIEATQDSSNSKSLNSAASLDGLLQRISVLHEIASEEIDPATGKTIKCFPWIILFVTLLFLAIELTPIFFKLMLTKTPYDYLSENRDDLIKAECGIEVRYDYYKDKEGQERHLVINHEAERMIYEKMKITEIQKELTDYAIEKYKTKEKEKIDNNLEDYIKKIDPNNTNDEENKG